MTSDLARALDRGSGIETEFDAATAVTPTGEGRYVAQIDPLWTIGAAPNGGYLLAIAQRAIAHALPLPDPLTITGHFLASPEPGPVTIEVTPLRLGRTLSRGEALLRQGDRVFLRAIAAFGRLPEADDAPHLFDGGPPTLPPIEACHRSRATTPDGRDAAIRDRFEIRYDPRSVGWDRSEPSGEARLSAWVRTVDRRRPDAHLSTTVLDAFPAAAFDLGLSGWLPTVELTVHHRARPADGWLRCAFTSRFVSHGLLEEDGELWDDEGQLVAMSRQLMLAPRTPSETR